ncbi:hypothetical protein M569_03073 [Genlisea aurea]|uniref:Uncharacterized protein n=1 Tax=Genlisea aurea TaxID=192259 RepID=S8E761_9LAMI|nr:hypothetical protein M569_03073 [Genlisea aurea]
MKASGSVVAAASVTAAVSSFVAKFPSHRHGEDNFASKLEDNSASNRALNSEKFAPKFDGLRFIETLITAHR